MARPTKFTPETIKRLTDALRMGAALEAGERVRRGG